MVRAIALVLSLQQSLGKHSNEKSSKLGGYRGLNNVCLLEGRSPL